MTLLWDPCEETTNLPWTPPQEILEKPMTNLIGIEDSTAVALVPNGKKILIKSEQETWNELEMTDEDFNQLFPNLADVQPVVNQEESSHDEEICQTWGTNMINEMTMINPMEAEGRSSKEVEEPDLLSMIMDDTLQPEDDKFQNFVKIEVNARDLQTVDLGDLVGPSTSSTNVQVVTVQNGPVKRGRGRPRLPRNYEQSEIPR